MARSPLPCRSPGRCVEWLVGARNDRQQSPRHTLAADVEDRPHLHHAGHRRQGVAQRPQFGEGPHVEHVARTDRGPHDAIPLRSTEPLGHLVDQAELGRVVAEQRPQVVVEPEPRDADDGGGRQADDDGEDGPAPASGVSGSR